MSMFLGCVQILWAGSSNIIVSIVGMLVCKSSVYWKMSVQEITEHWGISKSNIYTLISLTHDMMVQSDRKHLIQKMDV